MGTMTINIPDKVEDDFRRIVGIRKKGRHGGLGEGITEALQLWMDHPELVGKGTK